MVAETGRLKSVSLSLALAQPGVAGRGINQYYATIFLCSTAGPVLLPQLMITAGAFGGGTALSWHGDLPLAPSLSIRARIFTPESAYFTLYALTES